LIEDERKIEDHLREQYFDLLPEMRRVADQLEAEVKYHLLPLSRSLSKYEGLTVKCRVKACESAVDKLRARQEGATFDRSRPDLYSLTSLNDLAGVRVMAFPRRHLVEIDRILRGVFGPWNPDPVADDGRIHALKYHGYCEASSKVKGEYQIVSMLIGLFWEVEHAAIYKPDPGLRGINKHLGMRERTREVFKALEAFEEQFDSLVAASQRRSHEIE